MAGNAFALAASFFNLIATFILQWQTSKDHENITNSEKDWQNELKMRELEQILTPHGVKLERRTQLKYKKERIGSVKNIWNNILQFLRKISSMLYLRFHD